MRAAAASEDCSYNATGNGCVGPVLGLKGLGLRIDALSVRVSPPLSPWRTGVSVTVAFPAR